MQKRTFSKLMFVPALLLSASFANGQGIISTISGNGIAGFSGDGAPAISAQFNNPSGVAVNSVGDVYIADKSNSRIRMISGTTGIMSTYAGNGIYGLSGLGGPATSMSMRLPNCVNVRPTGDLMISDWYNDMVYQISYSSHDNDDDNNHGDGHQGDDDDCISSLGRLKTPSGVCSDTRGHVYIADNGNNRVRFVVPLLTASGTYVNMIHTLANSTGASGYSGDGGLAIHATFRHLGGIFFDNAGNTDLYVSDMGNNVIRKINLETGIITTVVGSATAGYAGDGGPAALAKLSNPGALFIDGSHNLYICDRGNNAIRKVNLITGIITTVAGNGTLGFSGDGGISTSAQLNDPEGVCADNAGNIYIADMGNQRIRKIAPPVAVTPVTAGSIGTVTSVSLTGPAPVVAPHMPASYSSSTYVGHYAGKTEPGISNIGSVSATRIFPNPSTGVFTLEVAAANGNVEVYNVLGEKVYATVIGAQQTEINLSNQPAGIYTLSFRSTDGVFTQKLTINR